MFDALMRLLSLGYSSKTLLEWFPNKCALFLNNYLRLLTVELCPFCSDSLSKAHTIDECEFPVAP